MITTTIAPIVATRVAVDLGPTNGPKAERFAQIAASFLDQMIQRGPIALVVRDSQGIALLDIATSDDVSASLAAAVPGEPVPLDDIVAYVGAWRNDLDEARRRGILVVSDDYDATNIPRPTATRPGVLL